MYQTYFRNFLFISQIKDFQRQLQIILDFILVLKFDSYLKLLCFGRCCFRKLFPWKINFGIIFFFKICWEISISGCDFRSFWNFHLYATRTGSAETHLTYMYSFISNIRFAHSMYFQRTSLATRSLFITASQFINIIIYSQFARNILKSICANCIKNLQWQEIWGKIIKLA